MTKSVKTSVRDITKKEHFDHLLKDFDLNKKNTNFTQSQDKSPFKQQSNQYQKVDILDRLQDQLSRELNIIQNDSQFYDFLDNCQLREKLYQKQQENLTPYKILRID